MGSTLLSARNWHFLARTASHIQNRLLNKSDICLTENQGWSIPEVIILRLGGDSVADDKEPCRQCRRCVRRCPALCRTSDSRRCSGVSRTRIVLRRYVCPAPGPTPPSLYEMLADVECSRTDRTVHILNRRIHVSFLQCFCCV